MKDGGWVYAVRQVDRDGKVFQIGPWRYDAFHEPLTPGAPDLNIVCDFRATPKHGNKAVMLDFERRMAAQAEKVQATKALIRAIRASLKKAVTEKRPNIQVELCSKHLAELAQIKGTPPETFDGHPIKTLRLDGPSVVAWYNPDGSIGGWPVGPVMG